VTVLWVSGQSSSIGSLNFDEPIIIYQRRCASGLPCDVRFLRTNACETEPMCVLESLDCIPFAYYMQAILNSCQVRKVRP
jgi:hypothetical protein